MHRAESNDNQQVRGRGTSDAGRATGHRPFPGSWKTSTTETLLVTPKTSKLYFRTTQGTPPSLLSSPRTQCQGVYGRPGALTVSTGGDGSTLRQTPVVPSDPQSGPDQSHPRPQTATGLGGTGRQTVGGTGGSVTRDPLRSGTHRRPPSEGAWGATSSCSCLWPGAGGAGCRRPPLPDTGEERGPLRPHTRPEWYWK